MADSTHKTQIMEELNELLEEQKTRTGSLYRPYPKQAEFHKAGAKYRQRLFLAGNQLGKSHSGSQEMGHHLTGEYPDWWDGRNFKSPVRAWVIAETNETTRDTPQKLLFGPPNAIGTGAIPKRCIGEIRKARGVADYFDTVLVKHVSGGESIIKFKAYKQGREKMASDTLDVVWEDEEPPPEIHSEVVTRTNAGGGPGESGLVYITATPLLGMTEVVDGFYPEPKTSSKHLTQMEIWDVPAPPIGHYTDEQKQEIVDNYPAHEREARSLGIPSRGSGNVFPVPWDDISVEPFQIPGYYYQIIGSDFGWKHPTAFAHCAIDRDSKTFYVVNAYRRAEQVAAIHAAAVRPWGPHPVAWPHDGYIHDKSSGDEIAASYRNHGLRMMMEHSTHPFGGFGTEAGVQEMHEAMETGHFKVFEHLDMWKSEFRNYHRKEGEIVKVKDDLMSATRMAWMMQRYACPVEQIHHAQTTDKYDPFAERMVQ